MIKTLLIKLFLLLSLPLLLQGQNSPSLIIKNIHFEGLKKNKASYLNNIINTQIGDTITQQDINLDIQNLKNIPGIANAYTKQNIASENTDTNNSITYHIEERKTALPIINLGGIKNNLWFRVGYIDNNWLGKGQSLLAYYQNNDKRHSAQIYFANPRVKNSRWGYTVSIMRWTSIEPLFFDEGSVLYLYDNNSFGLTGIFNIDKKRQLEFGATYFIEVYKQAKEQDLEEPPGPSSLTQNKWLTKLEYRSDFLNYHYFYLKNMDWKVTLQNVYTVSDKTWFTSVIAQTRIYSRLSEKLNWANRIRFGISTNNDSPFAPFVVDSHVNIRGVGNKIDRGTAQAIFNTELRYTLLHKDLWASQLIAFSDLGTWRNPGGGIDDLWDPNQFQHFVGLGFRVIYQKVFGLTLRVDYGIDVYDLNERGLVFGLGQYF